MLSAAMCFVLRLSIPLAAPAIVIKRVSCRYRKSFGRYQIVIKKVSEFFFLHTQSMFASLLEHLDGQQKALPPSQRGLESRLTELRQSLAQDPSLENNARFQVGVAWLLQDWKQMSGTGQQPWLPPREAAMMQSLKVNLPGLENEDVKALLRNSDGMTDQKLLAELRNEALRIAELPPGEQLALAIIKNIAVLDYRMQQAGMGTTQPQAAPVQGPSPDPVQTPMRAQEEDRDRPSAQDLDTPPPFYEPGEAPGLPMQGAPEQGVRETRVPSEELRHDQPQQETLGEDVSSQEADAKMRREDQAATQKAQHNAPEQPTRRAPSEGGQRPAVSPVTGTEADRTAQPDSKTVQTVSGGGMFPPKAPQSPKTEQTGPGMLEKIAEVSKGLGQSYTNWLDGKGSERDKKRMTELAAKVDQAAQTVDENISAFRTTGASFFGDLEKTVQRDGKTHQEVIAGMHEKGPYARLRQQFDKALADNPMLAEQHATLKSSLNTLNNRVRNLNLEARQAEMQDSPVVAETNKKLSPVADRLEKLPSSEPGANMLERAGNFIVDIVENVRRFLDQLRGKEAGRERDNSPAMSR
ncbi:hypothetical protein [Asaia bogorensis]